MHLKNVVNSCNDVVFLLLQANWKHCSEKSRSWFWQQICLVQRSQYWVTAYRRRPSGPWLTACWWRGCHTGPSTTCWSSRSSLRSLRSRLLSPLEPRLSLLLHVSPQHVVTLIHNCIVTSLINGQLMTVIRVVDSLPLCRSSFEILVSICSPPSRKCQNCL